MTWTPLQHQVYRILRGSEVSGRWLVLLSGGLDSMVLLETLQALSPAMSVRLAVCHVHHGPTHPEQLAYRDQALVFCQRQAEQRGLPFFVGQSEFPLSSEAAMRDFRKQTVVNFAEEQGFERVVYAHHQDDFLETQILRLIRGTGSEGVRTPMKLLSGRELRPFLTISRAEIEAEAKELGLLWQDDPSNQSSRYLRNWLRHEWLPALEDKCPGALGAFSRSLSLLLQESHSEKLPPDILHEEGLARPLFLTLTEAQKCQCLAQYIRNSGVRQYTHNQIKEIMKHLDISQVEHKFEAAQLTWTLSREFIKARPL